MIIKKADIDAEVERLSQLDPPASGRREALMLVHPRATAPGNGLAPGIRVTLSVLLPGEHSADPPQFDAGVVLHRRIGHRRGGQQGVQLRPVRCMESPWWTTIATSMTRITHKCG